MTRVQTCDHVALLLPALEPALEALAPLDLPAGPIEEFPGEGTREVYLGEPDAAARLLLLQPLGSEGPYARALAKRGPGLHHLAYRAPDVRALAATLPGWLLVPASLSTYAGCQTLWLARPGVGALIELSEGPSCQGPPLVEQVEVVAQDAALAAWLLAPLQGATGLVPAAGPPALTVAGRRVELLSLV